jgi:hypothetical protein
LKLAHQNDPKHKKKLNFLKTWFTPCFQTVIKSDKDFTPKTIPRLYPVGIVLGVKSLSDLNTIWKHGINHVINKFFFM